MSFTNTRAALENMVIVRDVLAAHGIPLFLNFGTLLGAMREHDFIPHDHDVDTGIYQRDEAAFVTALPEMAARGLEVSSIWSNRRCYSLVREGEQIDIFVAHERRTLLGRRWNLDGKVSLPASHFDRLEEIDFLGYRFKIPHDPLGVLRYLYGRTWNIPIDGKVSRIDVSARVLAALKSPLKTLAYVPTFVGNRLKWAADARRTARAKDRLQQ